jgi:hypothetical protein
MKLKLPNDPIQLVLGKSFHLALELAVKDGLDPVDVFTKDFTRDKLVGISLAKFQTEREEALRLLSFWKENGDELLKEAGIKIAQTEIPFEIQVEQDPLTKLKLSLPPIKGVIDFSTETKAIGDYKTSSKKYSQQMVDESDQPTFYCMERFISQGELPDKFVYIIFRKKIKRMPIQILTTSRTMTQVSALLADIQRVTNQINNKEFTLRHQDGEFCDCYLYEDMLKI